jgi:hypothetical protein
MLRAVCPSMGLPGGAFKSGMRKKSQLSAQLARRWGYRTEHSNRERDKVANALHGWPFDGATVRSIRIGKATK